MGRLRADLCWPWGALRLDRAKAWKGTGWSPLSLLDPCRHVCPARHESHMKLTSTRENHKGHLKATQVMGVVLRRTELSRSGQLPGCDPTSKARSTVHPAPGLGRSGKGLVLFAFGAGGSRVTLRASHTPQASLQLHPPPGCLQPTAAAGCEQGLLTQGVL